MHGLRRSAEKRILTVTHDVALSRGDGWVEVQTTVDNTAEDHRLRLRLSAEVEGATYFASQPFCFVERKAGVDIATQTWEERALLERQTSGIVCKQNARGGPCFPFRLRPARMRRDGGGGDDDHPPGALSPVRKRAPGNGTASFPGGMCITIY